MQVGDNISYEFEGRTLVLRIDLDEDLGPSSTGNSNFVAKTGGWQSLQDEAAGVRLKINLNLVKPVRQAR